MMASVSNCARRDDVKLLSEYAATQSPDVLRRLVERYRPLARSLARRYRGGAEPYEDLLQVADLGLVKAIQGFDPKRCIPFAAYAVPTILGELRRHFRDRVWNLRLPRGLQESTAAVNAAIAELTEELSRTPTVAEVADHLDFEVDVVLDSLAAREARATASLDAPLRGDDENALLKDSLGVRELGFDRVEAHLAGSSVELDDREWEVLIGSFGRGMTQNEIGADLGISQMQVSRVSRKALGKLLAAVRGEVEEGHAEDAIRRLTA